MKKLTRVLLLSALLAGCGGRERETSQAVLTSAYVTRTTVAALEARYSQAFDGFDTPLWIESKPKGWEGVIAYRESAEGFAYRQALTPYARPAQLEDGFRHAAELREMSLVTAELVNLVLEPRGSWISFGQEMNGIRTRFDRALLALETVADRDAVVYAKRDAKWKGATISEAIATAVAKADEEDRRRAAESQARAEAEQRAREEDVRQKEQREREQVAAMKLQWEEERQRTLDGAFKRKASESTSAPADPPAKLGGGTFPTAPPRR